MLIAFCDNLVPFEEHIFVKGDGFRFVSMYFESLNNLAKSRMVPVTGVIEAWKGIMSWKKNKENEVAS